MSMTFDVPDYLFISLKEEEKLLHMKWLRNVVSEEYRAGIKVVKEIILHHKVELWLIDSRLIDSILFADQQWIKREIAPLIKLSNLQRIARVLTDDIFNYISFENMIEEVKEEHDISLDLAQFSSLEAAFDWLRMD
ncbi:hypothetical protein ACFS7Z_03450 [Pontibacter toksunensis]|uniref:STAS/SEC14 domain-containing protein n=1 Tax=Pontibacter toksunensis TaxID=1332631 RepID=A0ABW6BNS7_9BACT